jgi:hypothetical protein
MRARHFYENEVSERLVECGDEGVLCDACRAEEAASWARHFGLKPGMTPAEQSAQLERFKTIDPWRDDTDRFCVGEHCRCLNGRDEGHGWEQ